MMTDTNGQTLVTQLERQALIQKLNAKWPLDLSTRVENLAYEKSRGVKPVYFKMVQTYYQQVQNANLLRANQQQQQQQQQQQPLNNNGQFLNQQQQQQRPLNNNGQFLNQQVQSTAPVLNHPQLQLNQQSRFSSPQQSLQPRMTNPQSSVVNNQSPIPNQGVLSRDPQKFNYTSSARNPNPSNIPTVDLSQNYISQQQITNANLSGYLSQPSIPQNRYPNQPIPSLINPRPRLTTNLNGSFPPQLSSNNSKDVLHQFVVGNTPTTSMTNTSSNGDRLLQQILLSNNDGSSNKTPLQSRQSTPTIMSQPIRSASTMNSNLNPIVNSRRSSLTSQQPSPSSSVIIMPTSSQTSNIQIQPSTNISIQQSPLNTSIPQIPSQPPSIPMNNSSTPLLNNYSSPINPPSGSGSISSPDEETINLIKFLKDNIGKLQALCQRFTNDGNVEKARNAQSIHQQMLQFINNPTYESLTNAKHIRDMLERASTRTQQLPNPPTTNVPIPTVPPPQLNEFSQFEKVFTEYISRDQKRKMVLNKLFIEPLSDVINGVPHKKIRLDGDNNSNRITKEKHSPSLLSNLNEELNLLPENLFSIELDEEHLNKNGIILRCKLLKSSNPLVPSLRLRISTRYPEDQPEILSLTKTMPPKLQFTDGHPFFEQLSTIFVSHLFKLPSQHTVTDILNIWDQSVQSAL